MTERTRLVRPTDWFPLSVHFPQARRIDILGQDFGPAGPYAFVCLVAVAKAQTYTGGTPGVAKSTWRNFASLIFLRGADEARPIVARIAELGLIELRDDGHAFEARCCEWFEWEPKDANAAKRKAAQRGRDMSREQSRAEADGEGEGSTTREGSSDVVDLADDGPGF